MFFLMCQTGEILRLTHVARGLDSEGVLLIDIVINGFVPPSLSSSHLSLQVRSLLSYLQTSNRCHWRICWHTYSKFLFNFSDPISVRVPAGVRWVIFADGPRAAVLVVIADPPERGKPHGAALQSHHYLWGPGGAPGPSAPAAQGLRRQQQLQHVHSHSGLPHHCQPSHTRSGRNYNKFKNEIVDLNVKTALKWTFVFADGYADTCPKGFTLDTASYCAGMLLSLVFMPHLSLNICHRTSFIMMIECVLIRWRWVCAPVSLLSLL